MRRVYKCLELPDFVLIFVKKKSVGGPLDPTFNRSKECIIPWAPPPPPICNTLLYELRLPLFLFLFVSNHFSSPSYATGLDNQAEKEAKEGLVKWLIKIV